MIRFVFAENNSFKESYWIRNDYAKLQAEIENGQFDFFEQHLAYRATKFINQILLELRRNPYYYANYEPKGKPGSLEDFIVRLKELVALCHKYPTAKVEVIQGKIK